jgi:hypothetical protein
MDACPRDIGRRPATAAIRAGTSRQPAPATEWTGEPPTAASHAAHTPSNDVTVRAKKPSADDMHMKH